MRLISLILRRVNVALASVLSQRNVARIWWHASSGSPPQPGEPVPVIERKRQCCAANECVVICVNVCVLASDSRSGQSIFHIFASSHLPRLKHQQ